MNHALKTKKIVFELKVGKLVPRKRPVKYISRRQSRLLFKKYRALQREAITSNTNPIDQPFSGPYMHVQRIFLRAG